MKIGCRDDNQFLFYVDRFVDKEENTNQHKKISIELFHTKECL